MEYAIWARCNVCGKVVDIRRTPNPPDATEMQIAMNAFVPACRDHEHNDFGLKVSGGKTWKEVKHNIKNYKQPSK